MFAKLCANPVFLLIGLLLALTGVFIFSLATAEWLLGFGLLISGSGIIFLSQRYSVRKVDNVSKPGQTQK